MSDEHPDLDLGQSKKPGGRAIIVLLCLIMIVSVLVFGAVDTGTLAIVTVLIVLVLLIWGWSSLRRGEFAISFDRIQLPLIALALVGLVQLLPLGDPQIPTGSLSTTASAALSLDPYATRFFLMRLALCVVFFAASLTFINSTVRVKTVVSTLIAFTAILSFYSILQRVEDPSSIFGTRQPGQAIPFGTYINRHHFAALLEMTFALTLGILFAGGLSRNRWPFLAAAAVVMIASIILTGSRGGMIGLFASIVSLGVFSALQKVENRSKDRALSPAAVMGAGFALMMLTVVLVVFLGGTDPLLRSAGVSSGAGDFTSGRMEFWQTAIRIFFNHPIIGVGLDAFGAAYSIYDLSSGAFRIEQAHNDYLQILADAGLLGFACVAGFIFLLIRDGTTRIRKSSSGFRRGAAIGALAGCIGILVHSFFDFPLRTPANAFVFLMLAVIATVSVPEESARRSRRRRSSSVDQISEP